MIRVQQGRELAHDTTFSISTSLDVYTKDLNMTNNATVLLDYDTMNSFIFVKSSVLIKSNLMNISLYYINNETLLGNSLVVVVFQRVLPTVWS